VEARHARGRGSYFDQGAKGSKERKKGSGRKLSARGRNPPGNDQKVNRDPRQKKAGKDTRPIIIPRKLNSTAPLKWERKMKRASVGAAKEENLDNETATHPR